MKNLPQDQVHKIAKEAAARNTKTRAQVKWYLSQVMRMKQDIKQQSDEINRLRMESLGVQAVTYDKVSVQESGTGDRMEKQVAKYIDMEGEVIQKRIDMAKTRQKIMDQIQRLDNIDYSSLLYKRYVEGKRLELIAVEMSFTYDHIRRMHGRALDAFDELYHDEIKVATQSHTEEW